jgi:hypothetical protein
MAMSIVRFRSSITGSSCSSAPHFYQQLSKEAEDKDRQSRCKEYNLRKIQELVLGFTIVLSDKAFSGRRRIGACEIRLRANEVVIRW